MLNPRGGFLEALQRFESFIERLMEGSFARLFRSPIQPAEIAKRLEREMEAHPTISVGRTYVPNHYEVTLNPQDFAEFEPFRHSLEHNMAEFISDLASERGYSLVSRPRVTLKSDPGIPRRGIDTEARLSDEPAASALAGVQTGEQQATPQEATIERTHAMPLVGGHRGTGRGLQPATVPPRASLQPLAGDLVGRDFPLAKTLISIGRGLDNDLVIDDPRVSRHHAQITFRHGHYLLRDQRSTNGTFVNDQPVETVVLASNDRVSIGGFELLFMQE
jgi:hypothetical protein